MPQDMKLPAWQSPYSYADARDLEGISPDSQLFQQGVLIRFPDPQTARNFLQRYIFDADVLTVFRAVLAEELSLAQLTRIDGSALLNLVAQRLATGAIRILCRTRRALNKTGSKVASGPTPRQAEAARKAARPAAAPPPPAKEPEPKAETEPETVDDSCAEEQANTLNKASEEGEPFCQECCENARKQSDKEEQLAEAKATALEQAASDTTPFCEECEKARATTPTPPQPPKAPEPAEAQAQVLKQAAENGTPFCEECEKAREELSQQEEEIQSQAEMLETASEEATPFCEECERARQAAKTPPVSETPTAAATPKTPAESQAEVLQQAAKAGTPFCQECEEAREAQDQQHQALAAKTGMLEDAAEAGTPFCAECEKAKANA